MPREKPNYFKDNLSNIRNSCFSDLENYIEDIKFYKFECYSDWEKQYCNMKGDIDGYNLEIDNLRIQSLKIEEQREELEKQMDKLDDQFIEIEKQSEETNSKKYRFIYAQMEDKEKFEVLTQFVGDKTTTDKTGGYNVNYYYELYDELCNVLNIPDPKLSISKEEIDNIAFEEEGKEIIIN